MLSLLLIASAFKACAAPTPLGAEVFSSTPFTLLFARSSTCNCGPLERTMLDLVRGCALTIFACVYRSLHPNVPDPNATALQVFYGRFKTALYALIAPEAVTWWAMRQWYGARTIARQVNAAAPDLKWTTTHGHFAQMGAFQSSRSNDRDELESVVIDPSRLHVYIREGRIDVQALKLSKAQIEDRSKGDWLSKGLAGLQTTWFIIECIARFQRHLPVTELEVVTLAFAILNIITYGFWWQKPLKVNCQIPIRLVDRDVQIINESFASKPERTKKPPPEPSNSILRYAKFGFRLIVILPFVFLATPFRDMLECDVVNPDSRYVPMFYGTIVTRVDLRRIRLISCFIGIIFGAIHFLAWKSHFHTHVERILWRSSSVAVVVVPFFMALFAMLRDRYQKVSDKATRRYRNQITSLRGSDFIPLVPTDTAHFVDCSDDRDLLRHPYFQPLSDSRPGSPELNPNIPLLETDPEERESVIAALEWDSKARVFLRLSRVVRVIAYYLGFIIYALARLSLITQAFFALRDLPPGAYETVPWTSYIPHL